MKRRYDYRCLECGYIFEIVHEVDEKIIKLHCNICKKDVEVEKQLSAVPFKLGWNTNY